MLTLSNDQLDQLCTEMGQELTPHGFMAVAAAIKKVNPNFNAEKFIARSTISYEDKYLVDLDDEIPY